jgi:hypothetical protein
VSYIGLLYWCITRRYLPKSLVPIQPADDGDRRYRLARSSYKVLHFIHGVLFLLAILWLPGPVWDFFLSAPVIDTVKFSTSAISLTPATEGSLLGLVLGVGVLIASAVIKEAEQLLDE